MKTVTKWALAFAAAVAIVVLTACGISQAPASQRAAPAGVQPVTSVPASGAPNGVAILTRAGVTGAYANGQDIYGDANSEGEVHSAGCTAADNCGEQFTIYTNADQATLNTNMAALLSSAAAPGGSDVIIAGPRYVLEITGVDDPNATSGNGTVYYLAPATVAQRIGGTIVH